MRAEQRNLGRILQIARFILWKKICFKSYVLKADALEIDNQRVSRVLQKHCQGLDAAFHERKSKCLTQN